MSTSISETNPDNWLERIHNSDSYVKDMLSYYENGWHERGIDDQQRAKERLHANLGSTFAYLREVSGELSNLGILIRTPLLKINNVSFHTVLISVSLDDYLSEKFASIYDLTSSIEKNSRSENYSVCFNFTFDEGDLDEDLLSSDGYINLLAKD